jgi:hypothetical protein
MGIGGDTAWQTLAGILGRCNPSATQVRSTTSLAKPQQGVRTIE